MKASGVSASILEDGDTYACKIKRQRKTPKKKDEASIPDIVRPFSNSLADSENIYTGVRPRTTQLLAAFKEGVEKRP